MKWSRRLARGGGSPAQSGAISSQSGRTRLPESDPMRGNHLQHSSGAGRSCGGSRGQQGGLDMSISEDFRSGRKYRWDRGLAIFSSCPLKNGRIRRAETLGIQRASGAEATGEV